MCKAPKAPKPKEPDKPEWLRNPYLDAATGQGGIVDQMRRGRSSLRTDMARGLGIRAAAAPAPSAPAGPPAGTLGFGGTKLKDGVRLILARGAAVRARF